MTGTNRRIRPPAGTFLAAHLLGCFGVGAVPAAVEWFLDCPARKTKKDWPAHNTTFSCRGVKFVCCGVELIHTSALP